MFFSKSRSLILGLALAAATYAAPAAAATCGNNAAGFSAWLESFKKEAAAAGISQKVIDSALNGLTYDAKVIKLDRGQHSFKLSFEQFYARRVNNAMISKGKQLLKTHAKTFAAIEKRYGVPGAVIVAIWGLETGFGANSGNMSSIRSLATLAYDCRRSAFFTNELMSALRIVQRGDMTPAQMRGAWAGELGQTQFLASSYVKFGVDFDGNGRVDLIRSVPDVLGSTANYLKSYGWGPGGWDAGSRNYGVLRQWNKAEVYVKTISVMASKIAG